MFIQKHQKTGWCCPKTQPFWQRWINSRESNGILEGALQRFGGRPMTKRKPPSPGAGEETVLPGSGDRSNIYIYMYTHIYIYILYSIYIYIYIICIIWSNVAWEYFCLVAGIFKYSCIHRVRCELSDFKSSMFFYVRLDTDCNLAEMPWLL